MSAVVPELPDVEVLRRRFARNGLKRRIASVAVQTPRILAGLTPQELGARLVGRTFRQTRRYGKRLYCALDRGGWVSMHFGLSGDLQFYPDDAPPPHFTRAVIAFARGDRVAYTNRRMIGRIEWVDDVTADVRAKKLGPDAVDPRFTPAAFERALAGRHGSMKAVLMDQTVVAGIGNAYSDEILFQCRLHPQTPIGALDDAARLRVYRAMRGVMQRAIACGAAPDRLPKHFFIPHRRAGEKCPRCGGAVRRADVAGRRSYYCPRCQPTRRRRN